MSVFALTRTHQRRTEAFLRADEGAETGRIHVPAAREVDDEHLVNGYRLFDRYCELFRAETIHIAEDVKHLALRSGLANTGKLLVIDAGAYHP
jgi:hypothetical protein